MQISTCIDVHHVVGTGFGAIEAGMETDLDMKAVGMEILNEHLGQRAVGDQEGGIVDADLAAVVDEMLLVEVREVVGLGHPVVVCLLGEAPLEDGAEEGGGPLAGLEECPLPQLGFRLAVVVLSRQLARIGAPETGVVYLAAHGAGILDEGWFYLCHNAYTTWEMGF